MHDEERRIAALAQRQDQILARDQLRALGISRGSVSHRLATGSMQRLHPKIYLLSYEPPNVKQRIRAAVMCLGDGTAASHRAAAILWGLCPKDAALADVDVVVQGRNPGRYVGIRVHRCRTLTSRDVVTLRGIPVTSPIRTLCDLAACSPVNEVESALTEAAARRLAPPSAVRELLSRSARLNGSALLRHLLDLEQEHGHTRSRAERLLRTLLAPSGLPMPRFNQRVNGHLVDCHWAQQKLILEVDGFAFHGKRAAFEADRRRDQDHVAAGYRVIRVTWRQLTEEPARVLVAIAQALAVP